MKKILLFFLILVALSWLALEIKQAVLHFPRQASPEPSATVTSPKPQAITQTLQKKFHSSSPITISEKEITALLETAIATDPTQSAVLQVQGVTIQEQQIRVSLFLNVEKISPSTIPPEFQEVFNQALQYIRHLGKTGVPITIQMSPQVFNGRIVYTHNLAISIQQLPLPVTSLKPVFEQVISHLIQKGILPARAQKIRYQTNQIILFP